LLQDFGSFKICGEGPPDVLDVRAQALDLLEALRPGLVDSRQEEGTRLASRERDG
jgi:hypothetical protein